MVNKNKIYNYIKIFIFTILIMLVIPKEAYKETANMNIEIEYASKENENIELVPAHYDIYRNTKLYMEPQQGYNHKIPVTIENNRGKTLLKTPTQIYEKYSILVRVKNEVEIKNVKLLRGNTEKIVLKNTKFSKEKLIEINGKEFLTIGKFSYAKIVIYFSIIFLFINLYLKKYLYKINKKISARRGMLYLLGLSSFPLFLNDRLFTRMIGIYLVFSLIYFINKNKKINFNKLTILGVFLYIYENINKYYFNKQRKYSVDHYYLTVAIASIWKYKKSEINFLGKMLYFSLIIVGFINYNSSIVFSNIFCFPFGTIMALLSVISLYSLLKISEKNKFEILRKIIELLTLLLGIYNIIYSDRRTAMVGFIVTGVIIITVNIWRKLGIKRIFIIIMCTLFISIIGKNDIKNVVQKNFGQTLKRGKEGSDEARLLMWRKSFYIIKENPLGIGEGNFKTEYVKEKYKKIEHPREKLYEVFDHPHNEYINEILIKGIIWGLGFLIFVLSSLKSGIKEFFKKNENLNFYLALTLLLCGFFEPFRYMEKNLLPFFLLFNFRDLKSINLNKKFSVVILIFLLTTLLLKSTVNIVLMILVAIYLFNLIWRKYGKQRNTKTS